MRDLPGAGLEPVSPALAGGFLITAPPGKSLGTFFMVHVRIKISPCICHLLIILKLIWLIVPRKKPFFYISEASSPWPACQRWLAWGFGEKPENTVCIDFPDLTLSITKTLACLLLWLFLLLANAQKKLESLRSNSLSKTPGPREVWGCKCLQCNMTKMEHTISTIPCTHT